MKGLIVFALIFASQASFSCTDFSGTFRTKENGNIIKIQQLGCDHLIFSDSTISFNEPLDGKYYPISSDQRSTVNVKVLINGDTLVLNTRLDLNVANTNIGENFAVRTFTEASKDSADEIVRKTSYVNKNGLVLKQEIFSLERLSN